MQAVGLDIGGTNIRGIILENNRILKQIQMPSMSDRPGEETIQKIVSVINDLNPSKAPVGISIAGRINKQGVVTFNPNIPNLEGVNILRKLKEETGTHPIVNNDSACFAYAENKLGAGKSTKNMAGIIIGTGIGGGIIINNELYRGNGEAGEIGHTIIDPSGPVCGCGKKGDFESWCSGKHITARYISAGGKIKNPDPAKIFFSKEKTAQKIMRETIDKIGIGLSNITAAFDPEAIIIGGGVSNLPFYGEITRAMKKHSFRGQKLTTKIKKAKLVQPGAIGAALLAFYS